MKKLPIFCSIKFLVEFYKEFDTLKMNQALSSSSNDGKFMLALQFHYLLSSAELFFIQPDEPYNIQELQKEGTSCYHYHLKNLLKKETQNPTFDNESLKDKTTFKQVVEKYPHAIFIIDETTESKLGTYKTLQNSFGVICFKHSIWKDKVEFLLNWALFSVVAKQDNGKFNSWKTLESFRHPCNSIVIAENYILNDKVENNLLPLLNSLLPIEKLEIPFQITFIVKWDSEEKEEKNQTNLQAIFNDLEPKIKTLRPDFDFELQIFCVNKELNHDRNIITNYLWLHSGHSFSYFEKQESGKIKTNKNTNLMVFPLSYQQKNKINHNSIFEAVQTLLAQAKEISAKHKIKQETLNAKNRLLP